MNKKNKRLSVVIFVLTLCSMLALLAACGGGKPSESSESGESAKSAYQQYIEKYPDYDGTEEEWLKDLLDGKLNDNTPDEKKHTVSFMYDENDETRKARIQFYRVGLSRLRMAFRLPDQTRHGAYGYMGSRRVRH